MRQASLGERLSARIAAEGPMSVADYMEACLHDPVDGYYAVRPALGAAGDFITAPHVSQMFGELLGLWAAEVWTRLGAPPRVRLVELGPGDGTLMSDVLRAAPAQPGFLAAAEVVLVETSAPLRARQALVLGNSRPRWAERIDDIGEDVPLIILANEFLDCLPIRQAVRQSGGWRDRRVGLADGRLAFVAGAPVCVPHEGPEGEIFEWSPALKSFGAAMADLISAATGACLFIDYGRDRPEPGDSLQALRGHRKEGPLDNPGLADLTARVDFTALPHAGPILTQGEFLRRLGIETRAVALAAAHPGEAEKIGRQLARLTGAGQMGDLFKVASLASPGLTPPGFEAP
jgi:SAM-dependent MidA family methyltransferase